MQVEIIAIGDELLLGQVENTNSGWIARKLSGVGISTRWMSVIEDTEEEINDAFRRAFNRADVTLITGGLGPTHDDITKKLLARFFNLPLVFRNDILDDVRALFKKRQLSFIESTREQAEFPEGATPMRNIHGTAPGIWINRSGKIFAAMPGVPLEMRTMMINFVLPRLQEKHIGEVKLFRTFYSLGAREATLFNALDNRKEVEKYAKLAFLPSYSGVRLRLTVSSRVREEALQRLDKAEEILRSRLEKYIFGSGDDFTIEQGVGNILITAGKMVVVAESCTGGLLAKHLTDTSGSSDWFERGYVTYSNQAKHDLLGVPLELIEEYGAVSPEVAEAMAEGALERSRSQIALSITGIAGPTGGTEEKPVGLVYIGYADSSKTLHKKHIFGSDRRSNRSRSVAAALVFLVEQLSEKLENPDGQLL